MSKPYYRFVAVVTNINIDILNLANRYIYLYIVSKDNLT